MNLITWNLSFFRLWMRSKWLKYIAILFRRVRKSPAMYKRIHGNFLDLLFRRQLDRAPANSHASRVQATPPPCPLCSQKVQNCLPNAYYTWRGSFYCIGHVKNDVCTQTVVGLYKKWPKYLIHSPKGICLFTALLGRRRGILDWAGFRTLVNKIAIFYDNFL